MIRVAHTQLEHAQCFQSFMEQPGEGLVPDLCIQSHAQASFSTQLGSVICVKVRIPMQPGAQKAL